MRVGSCGLNFAKGGIGTCCQVCCAKAMQLMEMARQIVTRHFAATAQGSTNSDTVFPRPDIGPELVDGTSRNASELFALSGHFGQNFAVSGIGEDLQARIIVHLPTRSEQADLAALRSPPLLPFDSSP